jgi:hypothetical protein
LCRLPILDPDGESADDVRKRAKREGLLGLWRGKQGNQAAHVVAGGREFAGRAGGDAARDGIRTAVAGEMNHGSPELQAILLPRNPQILQRVRQRRREHESEATIAPQKVASRRHICRINKVSCRVIRLT